MGIQGDGWTVMAADSQITDENSKIISPDTPKIIKIKDILIGLRGDARPGDIIAYNWVFLGILGKEIAATTVRKNSLFEGSRKEIIFG